MTTGLPGQVTGIPDYVFIETKINVDSQGEQKWACWCRFVVTTFFTVKIDNLEAVIQITYINIPTRTIGSFFNKMPFYVYLGECLARVSCLRKVPIMTGPCGSAKGHEAPMA